MEEIGKAFKIIFEKVSDFFDIFDLSFFVSGFFTTCIIYSWAEFKDIDLPITFENTSSIIVMILLCYINGLLSFALGRWIRMQILAYPANMRRRRKNLPKSFDEQFRKILKAHGLDENAEVKKYLDRAESRGIWRLYVKFWADIRNGEKYANSLSFLRRYWVMAATYDGLSISLFIGILLFIEARIGILGVPVYMSTWLFISAIAFLLLLFVACIREANRFVEYQIEEVVATIVSKR